MKKYEIDIFITLKQFRKANNPEEFICSHIIYEMEKSSCPKIPSDIFDVETLSLYLNAYYNVSTHQVKGGTILKLLWCDAPIKKTSSNENQFSKNIGKRKIIF